MRVKTPADVVQPQLCQVSSGLVCPPLGHLKVDSIRLQRNETAPRFKLGARGWGSCDPAQGAYKALASLLR